MASFEKIGNEKIQENEQNDISQLKNRKQQVFPLVHKLRDQPQQIDIDRYGKKKNGHQDAQRDPQVNIVDMEITADVDQYDGEKNDTDQPE
jgi:hypothetical protein